MLFLGKYFLLPAVFTALRALYLYLNFSTYEKLSPLLYHAVLAAFHSFYLLSSLSSRSDKVCFSSSESLLKNSSRNSSLSLRISILYGETSYVKVSTSDTGRYKIVSNKENYKSDMPNNILCSFQPSLDGC